MGNERSIITAAVTSSPKNLRSLGWDRDRPARNTLANTSPRQAALVWPSHRRFEVKRTPSALIGTVCLLVSLSAPAVGQGAESASSPINSPGHYISFVSAGEDAQVIERLLSVENLVVADDARLFRGVQPLARRIEQRNHVMEQLDARITKDADLAAGTEQRPLIDKEIAGIVGAIRQEKHDEVGSLTVLARMHAKLPDSTTDEVRVLWPLVDQVGHLIDRLVP